MSELKVSIREHRGFPGQGWWGLAAPRGTPAAIVERLNAEFVAPTSPAEFAAFLREDRKAAETLIRIANTKPEEYKPEQ